MAVWTCSGRYSWFHLWSRDTWCSASTPSRDPLVLALLATRSSWRTRDHARVLGATGRAPKVLLYGTRYGDDTAAAVPLSCRRRNASQRPPGYTGRPLSPPTVWREPPPRSALGRTRRTRLATVLRPTACVPAPGAGPPAMGTLLTAMAAVRAASEGGRAVCGSGGRGAGGQTVGSAQAAAGRAARGMPIVLIPTGIDSTNLNTRKRTVLRRWATLGSAKRSATPRWLA